MNAVKEKSLAWSQLLALYQKNPQTTTTKKQPQRQLWEECENTPTQIFNNAMPNILALFNIFQTF